MTLSRFALTLVIGLSSGMLTYLMAAGMSLIISGMGIINFGQGAFYVLGAYVCNQIFTAMGLPFGLALLGGFVVTALLGGVLERLLRPVFGKDMIFSLLITMGASYIICDSMIMVWGNKVKATGLPKFLSGAVMIPFTKIVFPYYYLFIIAIAALVGIAFAVLFKKTMLGVCFRAIINDKGMVEHLGINVDRLYTIMFMLGIGLGGLAGALNAPLSGLTPKTGLSVFNNVFPVLMFGGMNNINGCLPAAVLLGIISSFAAIYTPTWYNLVPTLVMIIVMFISPKGLFVKKER